MLKKSKIGTKNESSLHRALKFRYSGCEGEIETLAGSYVCDARNNQGELIEVQCSSFAPLREKIKTLTRKNKVRIIHPIIAKKYIELYDTKGRLMSRRKSPRKGSVWDLFGVLVFAPEFPLLKKLSIELAIIECVENRTDDGKGSWRRKGISINDRFLGVWHESVLLKKPKDYYRFIPFEKNEQFSSRILAEKVSINVTLARKTLYVLTKIGLVQRIGKQQNAWIYELR